MKKKYPDNFFPPQQNQISLPQQRNYKVHKYTERTSRHQLSNPIPLTTKGSASISPTKTLKQDSKTSRVCQQNPTQL